MATVAILVFAFALRGDTPEDMRQKEPGPCNIRLALEAARMKELNPDSIIISQWEPASWLARHGIPVDLTVELREDGTYLDSRMVWDDAKAFLEPAGIQDVIMVAQPWLNLHLAYVRRMAKQDGFHVIKRRINPIGFDDSELNSQPWTRTRRAFFMFFVKRLFGRKAGHDGKQVPASESPA